MKRSEGGECPTIKSGVIPTFGTFPRSSVLFRMVRHWTVTREIGTVCREGETTYKTPKESLRK